MFDGLKRRYRSYLKIIGIFIAILFILIFSSENSSLKKFIRQLLTNTRVSTNVVHSIEFLHSSYINLEYQADNILPIIVISKASNVELREAIRRTWASEKFFRNQTIQLKVFFLVGTNDFNIKRIYAEQMIFGDIIHVSLPEMYSFTAYKELSAMIWVRTYLPQAKFYIKTEDFAFINIPLVFDKLFPLIENHMHENYIIGWFGSQHVIQRGRYQKFINAIFPPSSTNLHHAMSLLYIITSSAADHMLYALNKVEYIVQPGDPFLTGILRDTAHIHMQNLAESTPTYQYLLVENICSHEFRKNKQLLLCASNRYHQSTYFVWDYFEIWNGLSEK